MKENQSLNFVRNNQSYFFLLLLIPILIAVYWPTFYSIVAIWMRSDTFAHGFLIFPISAYLIWRKREKLSATPVKATILPVVLIAFLILFWVLSSIADISVFQQYAVVTILIAAIWAMLGNQATKIILFPLLYLYFAVPFGEFLVPVLQDFTAYFTVEALRLVGIPVFWEGRFFQLPTGSFEVAEACSGVRYLIASIALGTLYAYLNYSSTNRRVWFIVLAVIIPIIANGVRAFTIVILSHVTDQAFGHGIDHIIYGWFFFGVVMFLLFWLGTFFSEHSVTENNAAGRLDDYTLVDLNRSKSIVIAMTIVIFMVSGPVAYSWLSNSESGEINKLAVAPVLNGKWQILDDNVEDWNTNFQNATAEYHWQYKQADKVVDLVVIVYSNQAQGAELINSENNVYKPSQWQRIGEADESLKLNETILDVNTMLVKSVKASRLIWHWYDISGQAISTQSKVKLEEVKKKLTKSYRYSAAIVISTPIIDETAGHEIMSVFLNDAYSPLSTFLSNITHSNN